jgi:hypothetical protein
VKQELLSKKAFTEQQVSAYWESVCFFLIKTILNIKFASEAQKVKTQNYITGQWAVV